MILDFAYTFTSVFYCHKIRSWLTKKNILLLHFREGSIERVPRLCEGSAVCELMSHSISLLAILFSVLIIYDVQHVMMLQLFRSRLGAATKFEYFTITL